MNSKSFHLFSIQPLAFSLFCAFSALAQPMLLDAPGWSLWNPANPTKSLIPAATALWLTHTDMPSNSVTYNWTNHINSAQICTNYGTTTTNGSIGVYFAGSSGQYFQWNTNDMVPMTNSAHSIWIRFTLLAYTANSYNCLVANRYGNGDGFYQNGSPKIISGSAATVTGNTTLSLATKYDLFLCAGAPVAVYTNGVAASTYTSTTYAYEEFFGLGKDADSDTYANFDLADFLIATNYTFTGADMTNMMSIP
jgi:hypothetical protein